MSIPLPTIRRYRRGFGWAMVVSAVLFAVCAAYLLGRTEAFESHQRRELLRHLHEYFTAPRPEAQSQVADMSVTYLISLASLATSGASLAGFCITSAISWRRERREQRHSDVDLEKKRLEIEKLRSDLVARAPVPKNPRPNASIARTASKRRR